MSINNILPYVVDSASDLHITFLGWL